MKKFLTMLLALSVVFTYTVGTAFAVPKVDATTSLANQVTASKTAVDSAAKVLSDQFTYSDGYLTRVADGAKTLGDATDKGASIIPKTVIDAKIADLVATAKRAIDQAANTAMAGWGADVADVDVALKAVKDAELAAIAGTDDATGLKVTAVIGALSTNHYPMTTLIAAQAPIAKAAAIAEINSYDANLYSGIQTEYKIAVTAAGATTDGAISNGNTGVTAGNYSAKAFVEAIKTAQLALVDTAKDANLASMIQYSKSVKIVKDYVKGHKKTTTENYYIAPVPTKTDIAADKTLEAQKSYAIKQLTAKLSVRGVELQKTLATALAAQDQLAKPDTTKIKEIKDAQAILDKQLAAALEVYTAKINAQTTTATVDALVDPSNFALGTLIVEIAALDFTATYTNATLEKYVAVSEAVASLKVYAKNLEKAVDALGGQLFDNALLASNLADQIESLYTTTHADVTAVKTALTNAENALADSSKTGVGLITAKSNYIKFINNDDQLTPNPKDINGAVVAAPWLEANDTNYDAAQKAQLVALVAETEKAFLAAKDYKELATIFANAHVKYIAIDSITTHTTNWATNTGSLDKAYKAGKYDTDLAAYITYALAKVDQTAYSKVVAAAAKVDLSAKALEVVKEAYTVAEIPEKVKAAKAYVDSVIFSNVQLDAKDAEINALITKISSPVKLTDKDVIKAAWDAQIAYNKLPGATQNVSAVLTAAVGALKSLEGLALDAQYKALNDKTIITVEDKAAVEKLRADFDAFCAFYTDRSSTSTSGTATVTEITVKGLETKVSTAQLEKVYLVMNNLPAFPETKDIPAVKAARAAFDALTINQKVAFLGNPVYEYAYDKLVYAEAKLATLEPSRIINGVKTTKLTAKSSVTKKAIKVTWKKSAGYKVDGYQIYRSTKQFSGFKKVFTTKATTYKNSAVKAGVKYFYKVRGYRTIDGVKYYTQWSTKVFRTAK